jgi:hypothetical protein
VLARCCRCFACCGKFNESRPLNGLPVLLPKGTLVVMVPEGRVRICRNCTTSGGDSSLDCDLTMRRDVGGFYALRKAHADTDHVQVRRSA